METCKQTKIETPVEAASMPMPARLRRPESTGNFGRAMNLTAVRLVALAFALLPGLQFSSATAKSTEKNSSESANEFLIVDCLLPGQVRKLGQRMTYLSPRRPVKTSASDCEIRGGEYVAFDRADYSTALKIWLPQAKEGDPEAQTYVGEIYEKGLGLEPDYPFAAYWYEQAANQGHSRALINLGHLYELGLGVDRDPRRALNLYRQASGIEKDQLLYASSLVSSHVTVDEHASVQSELAQAQQQSRQLETRMADLNKDIQRRSDQLARAEAELQSTADQLATLTATVAATAPQVASTSAREAELERELEQLQAERAGLEDNLESMHHENQTLERRHSDLAAELEQKTTQQQQDRIRYEALADEMRASLQGLQRSQQEVEALRQKLLAEEQDGSASAASLAAIRREVETRDAELELAQQHYSELRAASREQERQLEAVNARLERQSELVEAAETAFREHKQKLSRELATTEEELEKTREQLLLAETALQTERASAAKALEDQSVQQEAALAGQNKRLAELTAKLEVQSAQVEQQKKRIQELEAESEEFQQAMSPEPEVKTLVAQVPAPKIEILEPPVVLVRSMPTVQLRSTEEKRQVVGKVLAPAGIMSLSVNGREVDLASNNLFRASIPINEMPKPVNVVVIDWQGRRAAVAFNFVRDEAETSAAPRPVPPTTPSKTHLGDYHALIIGNNDYRDFSTLSTAVNDARETDRILRKKYGFKSQLLLNADRYTILSALNDLREKLDENDNLLIYYAGHGVMDEANERGYWIPVDADQNNNANWISHVAITDMLNVIEAKHILVVADSCFSGTLTQTPIPRTQTDVPADVRSEWIEVMAETRARITLTSGGMEPVLDGGGGDHSVFAKAFLNTLDNNEGVLEGYSLYYNVLEQMDKTGADSTVTQVPQYAPIHLAGHESGEFFFSSI